MPCYTNSARQTWEAFMSSTPIPDGASIIAYIDEHFPARAQSSEVNPATPHIPDPISARLRIFQAMMAASGIATPDLELCYKTRRPNPFEDMHHKIAHEGAQDAAVATLKNCVYRAIKLAPGDALVMHGGLFHAGTSHPTTLIASSLPIPVPVLIQSRPRLPLLPCRRNPSFPPR